jgi:poly(3-hydroxyalkanoate) synthetase
MALNFSNKEQHHDRKRRGTFMRFTSNLTQDLNPDKLLDLIGPSPADNSEGYDTAVLWKSEISARQVKAIYNMKRLLADIAGCGILLGPLSVVAAWQKSFLETWITQPAETLARILGASGQGPDLFIEQNEWIERTYAKLLYERCGLFLEDGKFNREKIITLLQSKEGEAFLQNTMREFAMLEHGYHSRGLTRLKALKDLLKCLLMVITEQPIKKGDLPFKPKEKDEFNAGQYLEQIKVRLENLYNANAFDIKAYSERATGGKIGCSQHEIVEGSKLFASTLRHYPLPKGKKANGKILYLPSPLVNRPEIYDLAKGKSVIEGMHNHGFTVYLADNGDPGFEESKLGLDFYGKRLHDHNLEIITRRHPDQEICVMAYCMGGTLILPYLARRAAERIANGQHMDIRKVVLMASPVKIDAAESGYAPVLDIIQKGHDAQLMEDLFGDVNIPVQVIESGMNQTQFGVQYYVASGFYNRALSYEAVEDAGPFFFWLSHGRMFPARAHREWIQKMFRENQLFKGEFCLPSNHPQFDGMPVDMTMLKKGGIAILDYRGTRDMISPAGSCVASEIWGKTDDGNRTEERNIGHIFVVSRKLLSEFIKTVAGFLEA